MGKYLILIGGLRGDYMEAKDLRKIKRKELLELMLAQAKRIEELENNR